MVQARQVRKIYGARGLFGGRVTQALDGVDMELRRGETLGVVGRERVRQEHAGARGDAADAGRCRRDPAVRARHRATCPAGSCVPIRKRVQMVFQDPYGSLDPRQRVVDIIAEGPIIHGTRRSKARDEARELLRLVGLDASAAERFPHEFSGGQRQRIGIARALALRPEILVADEPVSALDVSVQAQVLALLADIKARLQLSMLFVTHDLRVALQVCDRIAVMRQGQVVEVGADGGDLRSARSTPTPRPCSPPCPARSWQDRDRRMTPTDAFVPGPRCTWPGAATGPLAGLTFAVKDLIDVAGVPTGGGNPDWPRFDPTPARARLGGADAARRRRLGGRQDHHRRGLARHPRRERP